MSEKAEPKWHRGYHDKMPNGLTDAKSMRAYDDFCREKAERDTYGTKINPQKIVTRPSEQYAEGWDRIFGPRKP